MSLLFGRADAEKRAGTMAWWAAAIDTTPPTGRMVSEHSARRLVPMFAAWRAIIDFVSTTPLRCYYDQGDGTMQPAPMPLLLRRQNMPGYPGLSSWLGQALYGMLSTGNAVGFITDTDGYGFATDVQWQAYGNWTYDTTASQWYIKGSPVPSSQVWHTPWIVPAGYTLGLSPIEDMATMIAAGLSAQEYADFRRGGGIPPTILQNMFETVDDETASIIQQRAMASLSSGRPFITGKDWKLEIPRIPPNQALFIETLQLTANDIAAAYGIDPREVGGTATDSLTYSTDESKILNRASNSQPYMERLQEAIDRNLPANQCVRFDIESKIRTDARTQTEVLGWQVADGRRSVNEARAVMGLPPVPGGDVHNFLGSAIAQPRPSLEPTRSNGTIHQESR